MLNFRLIIDYELEGSTEVNDKTSTVNIQSWRAFDWRTVDNLWKRGYIYIYTEVELRC
jgi:hypothetical protein